jgi:hypothetical protein
VSTFTVRGVFIVVNGTSTDLERLVWHQVVAGWPSHVADRSGGAASVDSGFSHVDAWQQGLRLNRLTPLSAGEGVAPASRPLGPLDLGSSPLGPHVKYTLVVMMILTFGKLDFVIP